MSSLFVSDIYTNVTKPPVVITGGLMLFSYAFSFFLRKTNAAAPAAASRTSIIAPASTTFAVSAVGGTGLSGDVAGGVSVGDGVGVGGVGV